VRLPLPGDAKSIVYGQTIDRAHPRDDNDPFLGMRTTDSAVAGVGHNPTADRGDDRYNPNDPPMPVAWTKTYQVPGGKRGRVFAITMGAATDLASAGARRMLVNAVYWCVGLEDAIPEGGTNVDLVGQYRPTGFRFRDDAYWNKKAMKPADFRLEAGEGDVGSAPRSVRRYRPARRTGRTDPTVRRPPKSSFRPARLP
jgi:hypothetical protein